MTAPKDRTALEEAIRELTPWWQTGLVPGIDATLCDAERKFIRDVCDAAAAWVETMPKTKMVEVWHVEWSDGDIPHIDDPYLSQRAAEHAMERRYLETAGECIRVTGPHLQEVPST